MSERRVGLVEVSSAKSVLGDDFVGRVKVEMTIESEGMLDQIALKGADAFALSFGREVLQKVRAAQDANLQAST